MDWPKKVRAGFVKIHITQLFLSVSFETIGISCSNLLKYPGASSGKVRHNFFKFALSKK